MGALAEEVVEEGEVKAATTMMTVVDPVIAEEVVVVDLPQVVMVVAVMVLRQGVEAPLQEEEVVVMIMADQEAPLVPEVDLEAVPLVVVMEVVMDQPLEVAEAEDLPVSEAFLSLWQLNPCGFYSKYLRTKIYENDFLL